MAVNPPGARLGCLALAWPAVGCGPPAGIPSAPGEFGSAADLAALMLAANPDHLDALRTFAGLARSLAGDCPEVIESGQGMHVTGGGCTDSNGVTWLGSASIQSGPPERMDASGYGVSFDGLAWTVDGVLVTGLSDRTIAGDDGEPLAAWDLDEDLLISWSEGGSSLEAWMDVSALYASAGGEHLLQDLAGRVGLADWGTADLALPRVTAGLPVSCDYPLDGTLELEARNRVQVRFSDTCDRCPEWSLDGADRGSLCDLPRIALPPT